MSAKAHCPEEDCTRTFEANNRVDVVRKVTDHIRDDHRPRRRKKEVD